MRFAILVAIAVVVSSTPGLAAPAPFAPHRANSTHLAHSGHAVNGTAANSTHSAHHNPHHAHHGHAANATIANSTQAPKRAVTSDIVQAIEAAFDSLPLARKRDVITTALQGLESLGLSRSGSTVDKRFKLPEISPSTESALNNAANVATIGGGIAKVWDAFDGSSSSSKRDGINISKVWSGIGWKREIVEADERAFKIPASVTTWLKNLGNVASVGAGGAAIVGAVDGSSNSTLKREFIEADERALKIPASVTTWLKSLGNVASIGAGGAAIVGAVDGGSNSTLKREFEQAFDGVDFATLLNRATSQFENRGKISSSKTSSSETPSTSEVSGVESVLGKIAGAFSLGGTGATIFSSLEGSSNSTKRELDTETCGVQTFSEMFPGIYNITKREFLNALHGVDIATLLDGAAPQFEDRSLSLSPELESYLNATFHPLGPACG